MLQTDIQLNPNARMQVVRVGDEKSPVIIVDDAFLNPHDLVAHACQLEFVPPQRTFYPGLNAPLPSPVILSTVDVLRTALAQIYGLGSQMQLTCTGYFGLVTQPPADLQPAQTLPHVDTLLASNLAMVVYLCPPGHEGTGFYRHKATGFETLTPERIQRFTAAVEQDAAPPQHYASTGEPGFERMAKVDAVFNRLIVYRSNLFHSALVNVAAMSADPVVGRLTANIFVKPAL